MRSTQGGGMVGIEAGKNNKYEVVMYVEKKNVY